MVQRLENTGGLVIPHISSGGVHGGWAGVFMQVYMSTEAGFSSVRIVPDGSFSMPAVLQLSQCQAPGRLVKHFQNQ